MYIGFANSSVGKEPACNAGDLGLIPGLGRSAGEGIGSHFNPIFDWLMKCYNMHELNIDI